MFFIQWAGTLLGCPLKMQQRENNQDPKYWTENNIATMKKQLKQLGLSIDWNREISTCSRIIININKKFLLICLIKV